ncbi:hypothetical protein, partial [Hydrotalea sandarakina]
QKHRNISYADILKWNYSYDKSVSDAPKIIIDKAQEAIINNTYMIRIPLQDSKGMFYLYKYNNEVQSIFVRPNLYNGELKNIEFIDLKKSLYSVLTYKNNKKADSLYKAIIPQNNNSHNTNITSLSTNANSISSNTITAMGTFWFDLGCLLRLGIPRWDEYGDRVCYGIDWASLFDGSSYLGSQTNPPPFDAASFIAIFGVNPNYSLVSPSIWSDLNGGSSSGQYELSPTAFNYLVSTMQLDEFYSDWIIQHQHYASQIYNYISNEPNVDKAVLLSQSHFELLNSSQDYVQFNIRHDIFGDKSNVWWNDPTWLVNYYTYSDMPWSISGVNIVPTIIYQDYAIAPFIWTYVNDDGSTFNDSYPSTNPYFQFVPNDNYDNLYPNFTNLVKNLKTFVRDNPKVLNALQKWSGLSKQQILDKLTFGHGPTIKVEEMIGRFGFYNKKSSENILHIRASYVRGLEQSKLVSTKQATAFLLAVTILHEFVHYGTGLNNISEGQYDFGLRFERDAFNVIVDDDNAGNVVIKFSEYF